MLVRLCDEQRMGHLQHAAWSGSAKPYLRLPPYVRETPRVEAELKKSKEAGRTYDNARWASLLHSPSRALCLMLKDIVPAKASSGLLTTSWLPCCL